MTNEKAIQTILSLIDSSTASGSMASIYACEDVIEQDVLEWVEGDIEAMLGQFMKHLKTNSDRYIGDIEGTDPTMGDELTIFYRRLERVMRAMIEYVATREKIRKEIESER